MKNKKSRIDIYENIYPCWLAVANESVTLEQLKEMFVFSNGDELDDCITDGVATTARVKRKSDGRYMCLVKYNHPTKVKDVDILLDKINTISHEALHVGFDTFAFIEETPDTDKQETMAYLVGWAAECIYKTLFNK